MSENTKEPLLPSDSSTEDEDMLVALYMDDGSTVESRILTIFGTRGQDYIALLPLDEDGQDNADGIVYLYRYFEDEEGNPSLENIEADEEYEAAASRFDELADEAE